MKRLAVITTHPIQYYAPIFTLLASRQVIVVKVFYTWERHAATFDHDFGRNVEWDIPLLEGYEYSFVSNRNNNGRSFWEVNNPGLIKDIEAWKADAILVIGWNYRSHLRAMMHFKNRVPVLFKGDSTLLDEKPGIKTLLRRIFLSFIYRFIDKAFFVGTANKNYFLQHGIREDQLVFTPHAIDIHRFGSIDSEQVRFILKTRESLGIRDNDLTILFCGKLQAKKNPLLIIKAVKQLNHKILHLVLIGNGETEAAVKHEINGLANIHLLPFQNQSMMPAVYRLGEIFCLPSCGPGETWGLAVNEAMASGRAVLVSDKAGCHPDLVINGVNGYCFHSNDISDLQNKIKKTISSRDSLSQMGKASEQIISTWTFDAIVTAIEKTLQAI